MVNSTLALNRYFEMEDDLDTFLLDLSSHLNETVINYSLEPTEECDQFAPHPLNAVAIVIVTVMYDSEDTGLTIYPYHCYLDDSGKRMIEFGSDGEVADRIDQWLSNF